MFVENIHGGLAIHNAATPVQSPSNHVKSMAYVEYRDNPM